MNKNLKRFFEGLRSRKISHSSFLIPHSSFLIPHSVPHSSFFIPHTSFLIPHSIVKPRRGFTIVELLMVIGVIGILMGIVTTAAMGSLKSSRSQKAAALCQIVEQGMATYYAQKGQWPEPLGSKVASGSLGTRSNDEGYNNQSDYNMYILENDEGQQMIRNIVEESAKGNPMLDISGLYVSRDSGESSGRSYGVELFEAVRGTKRNPERMTLAQMNFGYPDPESGYFRHFKIVYSIPTDEVKVSKQ